MLHGRGQSYPRSMSIVAEQLPISATAERTLLQLLKHHCHSTSDLVYVLLWPVSAEDHVSPDRDKSLERMSHKHELEEVVHRFTLIFMNSRHIVMSNPVNIHGWRSTQAFTDCQFH